MGAEENVYANGLMTMPWPTLFPKNLENLGNRWMLVSFLLLTRNILIALFFNPTETIFKNIAINHF